MDAVGADLQVKDLQMDGCNRLFTVFSDSKNTFDPVQFSNYHSTEMIAQEETSWSPGGRQRGVESVTVEDVMMLKCDNNLEKVFSFGKVLHFEQDGVGAEEKNE